MITADIIEAIFDTLPISLAREPAEQYFRAEMRAAWLLDKSSLPNLLEWRDRYRALRKGLPPGDALRQTLEEWNAARRAFSDMIVADCLAAESIAAASFNIGAPREVSDGTDGG